MSTHLALLRGINLGGRNKVAMAGLRELVAQLGHSEVSTYIQSGNVLFTAAAPADPAELARQLTAAIAAKLGVTAPAVVLARPELAAIIAARPFPAQDDPKAVHAVVLTAAPSPALAAKVAAAAGQAAAKGARDEVVIAGRALYLHTPDGYGRSDLAQGLVKAVHDPQAGVTGTARNWATITRLAALADS